MNAHWVYTIPGSLVITAILAWPMSRQDSQNLFERIRFCVLSMLGVALFVWGAGRFPQSIHDNMSCLAVAGPVIAVMAAAFLILLWLERVNGMLTDLLLGSICADVLDDSKWDPTLETRQIEEAVQLLRRGHRRRALRLCNRIIASDSRYASTATTLAYWIENPGTLRIHTPPRSTIRVKGRFRP